MGQVRQRESDDIFVSGVKAKELVTTININRVGLSFLLFLLQWKNHNDDLMTIGSLVFGI